MSDARHSGPEGPGKRHATPELTADRAFPAQHYRQNRSAFHNVYFRNDRLSRMFIPRRNISENHPDFVQAPTES
jgi:hypothetical protein